MRGSLRRWSGTLALGAALVAACGSGVPEADDEVAVEVEYVALDPQAGAPVLLLKEIQGDRKLPIWIGFEEARSIATEMEKRESPRPNTHDLAKRVIDRLEAGVERVVVTELRDRTYFAILVLRSSDGLVEIDSRPSDAIALALRFQAPVFVRASVFKASEIPEVEEEERSVFAPAPERKLAGNSDRRPLESA